MPSTAYVFAEEYLTTSDTAVRAPLNLTRSAAESTPTTEGLTSAMTAPRSVAETVTPTDSLATSVTRVRSVSEGSPPSDQADGARRYSRAAQEGFTQSYDAARVQSLLRSLAEAPGAITDAVGRILRARRSIGEAAEVASTPSRTQVLRRSATEALGSGDSALRGFVWQATAGDTVTPTDTSTAAILGIVVPHLLSLSVTPDEIALGQTATVEFTFSVPVAAWVVRVGSTCPFDGNLLAHQEGGFTFSGSAVVSAHDLGIYGASEIQVYGMSRQGFWGLSTLG